MYWSMLYELKFIMMRRLGAIWWIIVLCIMATIVYRVHPEVHVYGMHWHFFGAGRWDQVGIQFAAYQFFHGGALHLFSNAFFLVFIGIGVQYAMWVRRFLYMMLFTTLFVGAILMLTVDVPTIGMSGFAMTVLAYYTMMLWSAWNEQYKSWLVLIGLNIFIWLDPAISLWGHLWWAVAGALFWLIDNRVFKHRYKSFQVKWR